jgi:hypothetical protein
LFGAGQELVSEEEFSQGPLRVVEVASSILGRVTEVCIECGTACGDLRQHGWRVPTSTQSSAVSLLEAAFHVRSDQSSPKMFPPLQYELVFEPVSNI